MIGDIGLVLPFVNADNVLIYPDADAHPGDPVKPGQSFSKIFSLPDSCIGAGSCQFSFGFDGVINGFQAFAFAQLADAQAAPPSITPSIVLDFFHPGDPIHPGDPVIPVFATGPLIAFDAPIQIGVWNASVEAATPLPGAIALFPTGVALLGWLGLKRQRRLA